MNMKNNQFETSIAIIIFNRPEHTKKVFDQIAKIKPKKLFIISDGPRKNNKNDVLLIDRARSIFNSINWNCKVYKNYSQKNLGCKYRPASGIDWVFAHTEEAIILEDDCYPDLSFFKYCEELLKYYRDDLRVGMIAGSNLLPGCFNSNESYFFSNHVYCWGWATWKSRWKDFDLDLKAWPKLKNSSFFEAIHVNKKAALSWKKGFDLLYKNKIDAWDYQWLFTNWLKRRVTIVPKNNLVSNIGFDNFATHTFNSFDKLSNIKIQSISFPLKHPGYVYVDSKVDNMLYKKVFGVNFFSYIKNQYQEFKDFIKKLPGGNYLRDLYKKIIKL